MREDIIGADEVAAWRFELPLLGGAAGPGVPRQGEEKHKQENGVSHLQITLNGL